MKANQARSLFHHSNVTEHGERYLHSPTQHMAFTRPVGYSVRVKASRLLLSLLLALPTACSDWPFEFGEDCTAIGCLTFLRVELVFASDVEPNAVEVVVEHDGNSFTCDFGAELDPCHKGFGRDFDPGAAPGSPTDKPPLIVLLDETPDRLRITATSAAGTDTRTVEPQYERTQPNGPGCGPGCLSASTTAHFDL